jgi:hypothetical protein
MLTVCLAPLVTHICFGFAEPVILADRRPRVSDRLVQFNPITIVWRWYAIVNRRIRAKSWDRADMAATNAIFWDGHRWDGSEEMMLKSRAWVTKLPEHTRVNWISSSTLATAAMTLQGVDALLHLIHGTKVDWNAATDGLPNIFYPVAILSLAGFQHQFGSQMNMAMKRPAGTNSIFTISLVKEMGHNRISCRLRYQNWP